MYKITKIDPFFYKQQIIRMWNDNLSGTLPERFDWLNSNNPAGDTIWIAAFEQGSEDIAGLISILPKDFYLNGSLLKGGIVGDIMVQSQHRGRGLGLKILHKIVNQYCGPWMDFLYVIPNENSKKIVERAGFYHLDTWQTLVMPINMLYYKKYVKNRLIKYLMPMLGNLHAKVILLIGLFINKDLFRENRCFDDSFSALWSEIRHKEKSAISDHSINYLRWRLSGSSAKQIKILRYKNKSQNKTRGYVIYSLWDHKICILDIISSGNSCTFMLLLKLFQVAVKNKLNGVYITLSPTDSLFKWIKLLGMINIKEEIKIFYYGDAKMLKNGWHFFSLDRNLQY